MNKTPRQLRDEANSPWTEEEKGPHIKKYEREIAPVWPENRPRILKEYIDAVLEEEKKKKK